MLQQQPQAVHVTTTRRKHQGCDTPDVLPAQQGLEEEVRV